MFGASNTATPLAVLSRVERDHETVLFIGAGNRREWLRAARLTKTAPIWRRGYPPVEAVMAAVREGGSLLEEHAVIGTSRRLLRGFGKGRLQANLSYRVLPGVIATVESSNSDGSAETVSLRFRSQRR